MANQGSRGTFSPWGKTDLTGHQPSISMSLGELEFQVPWLLLKTKGTNTKTLTQLIFVWKGFPLPKSIFSFFKIFFENNRTIVFKNVRFLITFLVSNLSYYVLLVFCNSYAQNSLKCECFPARKGFRFQELIFWFGSFPNGFEQFLSHI